MSFDKERLAVAIGKNGDTKKRIETLTRTKIFIDSETGEYRVEADDNAPVPSSDDQELNVDGGVRVFATMNILNAINYGFNPEKALKLIDPEYNLEIIDLENLLGHSDKKITRIKGRLIGEDGKIRGAIEQFAGINMSIYKRFLALIGDFESIKNAKKAINMLVQGAPHKAVLNYLEEIYQEKKKENFTKIWKPTI